MQTVDPIFSDDLSYHHHLSGGGATELLTGGGAGARTEKNIKCRASLMPSKEVAPPP